MKYELFSKYVMKHLYGYITNSFKQIWNDNSHSFSLMYIQKLRHYDFIPYKLYKSIF